MHFGVFYAHIFLQMDDILEIKAMLVHIMQNQATKNHVSDLNILDHARFFLLAFYGKTKSCIGILHYMRMFNIACMALKNQIIMYKIKPCE